jgi:predicted PurR-regulated permease PerM
VTADAGTHERRALGWFALGAVLLIAWIVHPFATGLLLGALMGFTVDPMYRRLAHRTGRPFLASIVTVIASAVVIVGCAAGFVSLFVTKLLASIEAVRTELEPGGKIPDWVDTTTRWLSHAGISPESVTARLRATAESVGTRLAGSAGQFASGTFLVLLASFFALLTMHAVLVHWKRMVAAVEIVSPLQPEHTRDLLEEFRRVGRTTLLGTLLTGIAQGLLAGTGFWMTGVPEPLFLGIATAIASLVPAVGTLLVWVPAGLYLYSTGSPVAAILELLWGALVVVGVSDYVIRPRLVGDEAMPALLTFLSLFGGLEVMGLSGLIVGPVVMALAVAVLRLQAGTSTK